MRLKDRIFLGRWIEQKKSKALVIYSPLSTITSAILSPFSKIQRKENKSGELIMYASM